MRANNYKPLITGVLMMLMMVCGSGYANDFNRPGNLSNDYGLCISRGLPDNMSASYIFGRNEGTTDAEYVAVWRLDDDYNWLSATTNVKVVSTNAQDDSAGTGIRTITIVGLDSNYDVQSETLTMDATTAVTSANSYIRINKVYAASVGSGGGAAGTISVFDGAHTSGTPDTSTKIYASIGAGETAALQAVYTVPNDYNAYIYWLQFGSPASSYVRYRFKHRPTGSTSPWFIDYETHVNNAANDEVIRSSVPTRLAAKTDMFIEAKSGSGSLYSNGVFIIVLIDE